MIIDCHTHVGRGLKNRSLHRGHTGQELIALMDDAGVQVSCTFPPLWEGPQFEGKPWIDPNYEESNFMVFEATRQFPDRLIGFVRVNPNFGFQAAQELRRGILAYRSRGIKLHPDWEAWMPTNFELMDPIMEVADEFALPCYIHTGYYPKCEPLLFLPLAERWPRVNMLLGHIGYHYYRDAILVARRLPNVFVEPAGNSTSQIIFEAIRRAGAEKVVFGSDAPFFHPKVIIDRIALLPNVPAADRDLILGGNIARLLRLEGGPP